MEELIPLGTILKNNNIKLTISNFKCYIHSAIVLTDKYAPVNELRMKEAGATWSDNLNWSSDAS